MDCCKTWFAFLCADIIQRCIECCEQECPACTAGLLSPLLHYHNQSDLYVKLGRYYYRMVQEMDIADLFDKFILQFGWFSLNREEFIAIGQSFVRFSTPDAIFFGKYITRENDFALYGSINEKVEKPIKPKKRKKTVISQNDVSGSSTQN